MLSHFAPSDVFWGGGVFRWLVGQFLGDPDSLRSVALSHSVDKRAKTKTLKTIKMTAKC